VSLAGAPTERDLATKWRSLGSPGTKSGMSRARPIGGVAVIVIAVVVEALDKVFVDSGGLRGLTAAFCFGLCLLSLECCLFARLLQLRFHVRELGDLLARRHFGRGCVGLAWCWTWISSSAVDCGSKGSLKSLVTYDSVRDILKVRAPVIFIVILSPEPPNPGSICPLSEIQTTEVNLQLRF